MRRIHSLTLICAALFLLAAPPSAAQLSASHQETFTVARPGTRIPSGSRTSYHQIAWNTSGGPGACFLSLDYSTDGQVWNLGAAIPGHDCTQSGETIIAGPQQVAFVRVNVNELSNGAAIRTTYSGYQTNPGGPTGTVTSVFGRTGAIQATAGDYTWQMITGVAPIFSPNFQGSPTANTPAPGDNSNLVATTAFVAQALAACCGGNPGTAGVTSFNGRNGIVTPQLNDYSFAQISGTVASNQLASSLNLPGAPTAATAPAGTNTTQLATTAFVLANAGGTPGGTTLQGCNTAEAGKLICDVSIQGGTGNIGILTMPFAGSLPPPPGDAHAAIAPDSTGHLYWSPGNGIPFAELGASTGQVTAGVASFKGRTGAVVPEAGDYSAFFAPIGGSQAGPATALQFGSVVFSMPAPAPANGQCLVVNADSITGSSCGGPSGGVTVIE